MRFGKLAAGIASIGPEPSASIVEAERLDIADSLKFVRPCYALNQWTEPAIVCNILDHAAGISAQNPIGQRQTDSLEVVLVLPQA